jgi:hypothetical protein
VRCGIEGPRGPSAKKRSFINLDDDDSDDAPRGGRNKGRPDGRRKEKDRMKRRADQERSPVKIDEMMKSKKQWAHEHFYVKKELADKKQQDTMTKWIAIRENEKRKAGFQDRKIRLNETKEENRVMMMDPNTMDPVTKDWWEIRRFEILEARRTRALASGGGVVVATTAGILLEPTHFHPNLHA